jgi:hypothetical protein
MGKKPKPKTIPYTPGEIPPPGYVFTRIYGEDGSVTEVWQDPSDPDIRRPTRPQSKLTDEQTKRLREVYSVLRHVDRRPWDVWVHNFEMDQTPERELIVHEALAETYQVECQLRGSPNREERTLLWRSLYWGLNGRLNADYVLDIYPPSKALRHLRRAIMHLQLAWLKRRDAYDALPPPAKPDPKHFEE